MIRDATQEILRGLPIRIQGQTAFFHETPADVSVPARRPPTDPLRWSLLRNEQYAFYARALSTFSVNSTVIDFGAGERQFRDLTARFSKYVAMDFVAYEGTDIVCDLTQSWPLHDACADILIASNVFEHLPDTYATLRECARVLKPGGQILIAVPFLLGVHQAPYDFVRHTHYGWRKLLDASGFQIESIEPCGSVSDLVTVIRAKAFGFIYRGVPFRSAALTSAWRFYAKAAHRLLKMADALLFPLVHRKSPALLDLTLGYTIIAKKR